MYQSMVKAPVDWFALARGHPRRSALAGPPSKTMTGKHEKAAQLRGLFVAAM